MDLNNLILKFPSSKCQLHLQYYWIAILVPCDISSLWYYSLRYNLLRYYSLEYHSLPSGPLPKGAGGGHPQILAGFIEKILICNFIWKNWEKRKVHTFLHKLFKNFSKFSKISKILFNFFKIFLMFL